jgi:hypothetical protein
MAKNPKNKDVANDEELTGKTLLEVEEQDLDTPAEENSQAADLTVYTGPGTMLAPSEIFSNPHKGMFTTLDTTKNRAAIAAAMSDADYNLMEYFDKNAGATISMIGIMAQSVKLTDDETGEVTDAYRTVIFGNDGKTYAAVSEGVIGSLQNIFALYGFPTPENPIKVVARRKRTRRGYNVTNLIPVD